MANSLRRGAFAYILHGHYLTAILELPLCIIPATLHLNNQSKPARENDSTRALWVSSPFPIDNGNSQSVLNMAIKSRCNRGSNPCGQNVKNNVKCEYWVPCPNVFSFLIPRTPHVVLWIHSTFADFHLQILDPSLCSQFSKRQKQKASNLCTDFQEQVHSP